VAVPPMTDRTPPTKLQVTPSLLAEAKVLLHGTARQQHPRSETASHVPGLGEVTNRLAGTVTALYGTGRWGRRGTLRRGAP
jgi:hypothetical protein